MIEIAGLAENVPKMVDASTQTERASTTADGKVLNDGERVRANWESTKDGGRVNENPAFVEKIFSSIFGAYTKVGEKGYYYFSEDGFNFF